MALQNTANKACIETEEAASAVWRICKFMQLEIKNKMLVALAPILPLAYALQSAREGRELETPVQASLVREVFGSPFRTSTIDPRWLSSTVIDVAHSIYDERAFGRMPILADALMDAGCDSNEIINHCRSDGLHVRGCWVVDQLLGKT